MKMEAKDAEKKKEMKMFFHSCLQDVFLLQIIL